MFSFKRGNVHSSGVICNNFFMKVCRVKWAFPMAKICHRARRGTSSSKRSSSASGLRAPSTLSPCACGCRPSIFFCNIASASTQYDYLTAGFRMWRGGPSRAISSSMITFRTAIRESKDFEINPLTVDARCKATSIICKGHHTLLKRRVKFIHCCRYFLNFTPVPLSLTWETHNSLNMSNKVPFELTSNMLTGLGTKTEEESRVPLICISPSGGRFFIWT